MTFADNVAKAIARATNDFTKTVASVKDYAAQLEALSTRVTTIKVVSDEWNLRYQNSIRITRDQLPELRKAVGRVTVDGKYLCDAQENGKNMVQVTVKPVAKEFSALCFTYKTPLRAGGKCKVVETPYISRSLVCEV